MKLDLYQGKCEFIFHLMFGQNQNNPSKSALYPKLQLNSVHILVIQSCKKNVSQVTIDRAFLTLWQSSYSLTVQSGADRALWTFFQLVVLCCGSTILYPLDRFYRFWLSVVVVLRSAQYQFSRILTKIVNYVFSYQYKNELLQLKLFQVIIVKRKICTYKRTLLNQCN